MAHWRFSLVYLPAVAAIAALAGCGGGGEGQATLTPDVQATEMDATAVEAGATATSGPGAQAVYAIATAEALSAAETATAESSQQVGESRYENAELGFAFDYPAEWEEIREPISFGGGGPTSELDVMAMVAIAPVVQETEKDSALILLVNANTVPADTEIDELLPELDTAAAQMAGLVQGVVREKGWTQVGGLRARRYVIDFSEGTVPATTEQVFVVRPGLTFQLNCEADQLHFQEIRGGCQFIYDSFEFTPEQ